MATLHVTLRNTFLDTESAEPDGSGVAQRTSRRAGRASTWTPARMGPAPLTELEMATLERLNSILGCTCHGEEPKSPVPAALAEQAEAAGPSAKAPGLKPVLSNNSVSTMAPDEWEDEDEFGEIACCDGSDTTWCELDSILASQPPTPQKDHPAMHTGESRQEQVMCSSSSGEASPTSPVLPAGCQSNGNAMAQHQLVAQQQQQQQQTQQLMHQAQLMQRMQCLTQTHVLAAQPVYSHILEQVVPQQAWQPMVNGAMVPPMIMDMQQPVQQALPQQSLQSQSQVQVTMPQQAPQEQNNFLRYGTAACLSDRRCAGPSKDFTHCLVPKSTNLVEEFSKSSSETPITTVMLRNVPNRYTQHELIEELSQLGFGGKFDFLYAPTDFGTMGNVGYVFVNFSEAAWAARCQKELDGHLFAKHQKKTTKKFATVSVAHLQGLQSNLRHYEKSAVAGRVRSKGCGPVVLASLSSVL